MVYPHVCGAAKSGVVAATVCGGLSPRVWGSRWWGIVDSVGARSIPTCVGQPDTQLMFHLRDEVYPHVCGAACTSSVVTPSGKGLSPRVWGSLVSTLLDTSPPRSIPTCVGQPGAEYHLWRPAEVYPHVCGAATHWCHHSRRKHGLSPRVWGSLYLIPESLEK